MNHTFIIAANERARVEALVTSLNAFVNAISLTDCIAVLIEDERVAGSLDVLLTPIAIKVFKAKLEPISSGPTSEKKNKPAENANPSGGTVINCRRCQRPFANVGQGKLCPECKGAKQLRVKKEWTMVPTGLKLSHAELTQRLKEGTIEIGALMDSNEDGAYRVKANGNGHLTLQKVLE
jgi:Zn finger protein HypA/HybF involved in hydrogenase expression